MEIEINSPSYLSVSFTSFVSLASASRLSVRIPSSADLGRSGKGKRGEEGYDEDDSKRDKGEQTRS